MALSNVLKFVIRGEDKSANAFRKVKGSIASLSKSFFSLQTTMVGVLGFAGLGAVTKSVVESADQMQKLSIRLGIATSELSTLKYAADQSGISFNTLSTGIQRMVRRIAEANQGTGEAVNALKELGLDAQRLNQMQPDEAFREIAEAMSQVDNQADKVRLAMKLFDTEGVALVQMMEQGATGIEEMQNRADALGVTLGEEGANKLAEFVSAMGDIKAIFLGVAQHLAVKFLPKVKEVIDAFSEWWQLNKDLVHQKIDDYFYKVYDTILYVKDIAFDLAETLYQKLLPFIQDVIWELEKWYAINGEMVKQNIGKLWENLVMLAKAFGPAIMLAAKAALWLTKIIKGAWDWMNKLIELIGRGFDKLMAFIGLGGMWTDVKEAYGPALGYGPTAEAEQITSAGGETSTNGEGAGTVVNINQQISRSDVTAILNEAERRGARL
jgi:hypothetical protein